MGDHFSKNYKSGSEWRKVCWPNLPPSDYKLVRTMREGWLAVSPSNGEYLITLVPGNTSGQVFDYIFINTLSYHDEATWEMDNPGNENWNVVNSNNWVWYIGRTHNY